MKGSRPIGRTLICLALVLLGGVAAGRLRLAFLPTWSLPELNVVLRLPEAGEVGEVTRRWVVPLETAIRAAGEVRSIAGDVDAEGGRFRVRFRSGIDAERKAARLESELGGLRRHLPPGSALQVWPVGQSAGENAAVVWIPETGRGTGADERLLEVLQRLPEVRTVVLAGRPQREVLVRARQPGAELDALRRAALRPLSVDLLGHWRMGEQSWVVRGVGDRHLPLGEQLQRQGKGVVPLRSVADVEVVVEDPPWVARRNGESGKVLLVEREIGASPLALSRMLRRSLEVQGVEGAHFLLDESEPLRSMLLRLAGGTLLATLLVAFLMTLLFGWQAGLVQTLALPVALAASLNAFWLAGIDLDLTTLPLLMVALAGGLLFFALRQAGRGAVAGVFTVLAALALPVAVALAGGRMGPLLLGPAKAFALALGAGVLALFIPPLPALNRRPHRLFGRFLKRVLRRPGAVILGGVTVTYLCLLLAGKVLEPRSGNLSPGLVDLSIFLDFAEGSTLDQGEAQVLALEKHLLGLEEITDLWCVYSTRGARIGLEVRPRDQRFDRLRLLVRQLQAELSALGSAASVVPYAGGSRSSGEPLRFSDSLEDEARTDEEAFTYRYILRGTDLASLRRAHDEHLELLARRKYEHYPHLVRTEWRQPATRLELSPQPGVSLAEARRAVVAVRSRSILPAGRPLTAARDLSLRIVSQQAPQDLDDVPQRADLLGLQPGGGDARPLVVREMLKLHEEVRSPGLKRQSGRFVLPVNLRLQGAILESRTRNRSYLDQWLAKLPLPPGVEIELPEFGRFTWKKERLQLLAIGSAMPFLLLALAFIRLNSPVVAMVAAGVVVFGLALACPPILASRGRVDELTLLALGAALAASLPVVLEVAAALRAFRGAPLAGGAAYRWLVRRIPGILVAVLAWPALLYVPGLGLDIDRAPWVLPLRAASVAGLMTSLGALLLLPALLRSRRPPPKAVVEQARRPPVWYQPGPLQFAVRNLTKVYGNGFHALHSLNFRLEPGIVGLLGPNGAGKTTLLRILCGLLEPSRGQVLFRGVPIEAGNLPSYRRLVGFLPQDFNAYEGFTAEQFLNYWALERGLSRKARHREVDRLIAQVGLEEAAKRKVRDFSGGMRRRIGIARALLGDPPIVIVDEPTTGLDVESRNRLRESLLSVAGERIILFSTHIASDVAASASRILLLHQGRLLYDGAATGLLDLARGRVFETLLADDDLRDFSHHYRITTRVRTLEGIRVRAVTFGEQKLAGEPVVPNLEEAYLALIGEQPTSRENVSQGLGASLLDVEAWRS